MIGRAALGSLLFALAACSLAACPLACSSAQKPPPPRVKVPLVDPSNSYVSPARWDYHPPAPASAASAIKLADDTCLFLAEGGQRWLSASSKQDKGRVICSGKADASFAVAAEDLTSVIRRADGSGSWVFVSDQGSLYEAAEPLGPFTRTVPAPEPLAKVAGAGSAVLAATYEGRVLRWEAASGWRPITGALSVPAARVFDLTVTENGRALALAFPESLYASEDSGATWRLAGTPVIGARRLGATAAGDLGAQGVFESVVWRGAAFARGSERIQVPAATLDIDVGRAPSAAAVLAGRAVLDGDRYYEVVRPEGEGEAWLFAHGRVEGRLTTSPIPKSDRCANVRLGARGRAVVIACVYSDSGDITAEVRRSTDGGATWGEPLRLVTPDTDQVNIAVSPEGNAIINGVCRANDGTCRPSAPVLVRESSTADAGADAAPAPMIDGGATDGGAPVITTGASLRAFPASAPQLSGMALAPAFSADGRSAYFLGRRGKDDRISLFVSHDGGETFSPRTLQATSTPHPAPRPRDDEEPSEPEGPETFEIDETTALRPGEDGSLGMMVLRSRSGLAYVTTDDDGRILGVAGPPADDDGNPIDVLIAGFGRRVIAVSSSPPEGGSGSVWESLDGGGTWDQKPLPQALAREYYRGSLSVTCALSGCLIGDTISRVGWGGSVDVGQPERPPEPPASGSAAVRTPIVCDLSTSTKWSRIEDIYHSSGDLPMPSVRELMRGRSVWSALSLDRNTGALTATTASLGESGEGEARVIRRRMIGPRGARTATAISPTQLEGYAVVRAAYPADGAGGPKPGAPLTNVEIAWENFLENTSGRARVAEAGALASGDVSVANGVATLHASLISISSRGLFVRPHASGGRVGDEIFVDLSGRVERYASTPWPASSALGELNVRADTAAVGGEILGVGLISNATSWLTAILAKRAPGGTWSYSADALVPSPPGANPLIAGTNWAFSPKAPVGIGVVVADPGRARGWAHFIGFRSDGTFGPPEPVPTLFDLGERPRPCSASDRASTPRTVLHFSQNRNVLFPGERHPVLISEPRPKNAVGVAEPIALLTSHAVVHGTPSSPCLAAFTADSISSAPIGAAIIGDLTRSWLFRYSFEPRPGKSSAATPTLEYRPMTCRWDPSTRIPDAVWNQPGTMRP